VLFLGLPAADESEGFDRAHIRLPDSQTALVARVAAASPAVVAVLANGSVVQLSDWEQHARAVLECWLSGQAAGGAAADLLLGTASPSGRLAETVPVRLEDSPSFLNFPGEQGHVRYGEGIFVGYRGHDRLRQQVSYPFGHGLSYTSFGYAGLIVEVSGSQAAGTLAVEVACQVTNTGERPGKEVVQLYVGDLAASVARPVRELKGFTKVDLRPGETTTVVFRLQARDLSFWSVADGGWVLEAGQFELAVGSSSRDLRLTAIVEVDAPPVRPALDGMSTLQEWLADPDGAAALRAVAGTDENGRPNGILGNQELMKVIGNFPVSTLAAFPGLGIGHDALRELLAPRGR